MSTNLADREPKKYKQITDMISYILDSVQGSKRVDESQELLKTIIIAKQEMSDAQSYFDSVVDPELVDHAIYKMEAAKSQYTYLLKLAKDKGLRVSI
jgi:hypothetical protein